MLGFDVVAEHYPGGIISPVYLVIRSDGPILADERLAAVDRLTDALRKQPGLGRGALSDPARRCTTHSRQHRGTHRRGHRSRPRWGSTRATDLGPLFEGLTAPGGLRLSGPILRQYPQLTERLGLLLGVDGNSTRLIVALSGNPYDNSALDAFEQVDDTTASALAGTALTGANINVGGPSSFYADMRQISNKDFRLIVAVILGAIFVVLALLLKSLVAPFYLLASVVLSYAASMGITVVVFQGLLGAEGITFWLAPFLFVILVALGADYNIFIMSRIREEADAGYEIHEAVGRGLFLTGRVITSAGLILAGTFAALLLAPLPNLRQIGFGVTIGILIDTFIVRSLLVPAATMVLGRWAFWPRVPAGSTPIAHRRIHAGLAGVAVAALAATLVAVVLVGGVTPPVRVVATAAPVGGTTTGEAGSDPADASGPAPSSEGTAASSSTLLTTTTATTPPPPPTTVASQRPGTSKTVDRGPADGNLAVPRHRLASHRHQHHPHRRDGTHHDHPHRWGRRCSPHARTDRDVELLA